MDETIEKIDVTIDNIGNEDLLSIIIRYGLFLGAIFQLVCIGACLFFPNGLPNCTENEEEMNKLPSQNPSKRAHHRARKPDKKKRR